MQPSPLTIVREQIVRALDDIGADAIKTGMLGVRSGATCCADVLRASAANIPPLVLDPVMVAQRPAKLLDDDGIEILKKKLLPLAALVTPNCAGSEALTGLTAGQRRCWCKRGGSFARAGRQRSFCQGRACRAKR